MDKCLIRLYIYILKRSYNNYKLKYKEVLIERIKNFMQIKNK